MKEKFRVLVVDDDPVVLRAIEGIVRDNFLPVETASNGNQAARKILDGDFALIISDIQMPELDGFGLLRLIKDKKQDQFVILMTSFGSSGQVFTAIQEGVFDFLTKPVEPQALSKLLEKAFQEWSEKQEDTGQLQAPSPAISNHLVGKSSQMIDVYKQIAKAALTTSNVLILGESGTGKELVARAIHENSENAQRVFIAVNCGALSESLLESELFGHVKGAFTGATYSKKGLFEEADNGTLFLDEIGDISLSLQIKLLRALQEGEIKPVGSNETKKVRPRVIAATHRDLIKRIQEGSFREDLYYRIKVFPIVVPPLRDRKGDIPTLAEYFVSVFNLKINRSIKRITTEAMAYLCNYSWPGNVRELEHVIERAVSMAQTSVLFKEDFEELLKESYSPAIAKKVTIEKETNGHAIEDADMSLEDVERRHIEKVLEKVNFNKKKASEVLGIDRVTLYRKATKYRIHLNDQSSGQSSGQNLSSGQKVPSGF